jgi:hypothetical protein
MKRGRKPICPHCRSHDCRAKGYRPTVTMGLRPLRLCNGCGKKFTVNRSVTAPASVTMPEITEQPALTAEPAAVVPPV